MNSNALAAPSTPLELSIAKLEGVADYPLMKVSPRRLLNSSKQPKTSGLPRPTIRRMLNMYHYEQLLWKIKETRFLKKSLRLIA
ncbi:hypothetical protein CN514_00225 [Bacillus sp. AFS001701]|uniref:hypothetical protein n=1 Tax=Bacillus sp. AFS001701 TaxID=2033480 RepID=UPI000BF65A7A|nr:hypothetical protein [Bacillus sp. AFS001701]PET78170.1 hypothetical protein CN514_00225 [Bacillus sp. AFS001701]